jgi:hypothetical protein
MARGQGGGGVVSEQPEPRLMPGGPEAGQRWRDAVAELEYAERHGAAVAEVERLGDEVIEARVALFQAGVRNGWHVPHFVQAALDRDSHLLQVSPRSWFLGACQACPRT